MDFLMLDMLDNGNFLDDYDRERIYYRDLWTDLPWELYTNNDFRRRFRLSRTSIEFLCEMLGPDLARATNRSHALSVELQILIGLRWFATGHFFDAIGNMFGVHESTASRVVHAMTHALHARRNELIEFPVDLEDQAEVRRGFEEVAGFPNVVGLVDGTHIRLIRPSEQEFVFVNRKSYHSLNVQAVCDHKGRVTNVVSRWGGAAHDAFIYANSNLGRIIDEDPGFLNGGVLLGDSGYTLTADLLTPSRQPATRAEERFNRAHKRTRCAVERCFGRLKRKFHALHVELRLHPKKCARIVIAACALHNIAINRGEPDDEDEDEEEVNDDAPDARDAPAARGADRPEGVRVRADYVQQYFTQRVQ